MAKFHIKNQQGAKYFTPHLITDLVFKTQLVSLKPNI